MTTTVDPLYIKDKLGSLLNNSGSLIDPYKQGPSDFTRPGNNPQHFITSQLNLVRRETFPKGFVEIAGSPKDDPISLGAPRIRERTADLNVYYYVVRNTSGSSLSYQNEEYVEYMLEKIKNAIEVGYKELGLERPRFGEISPIVQIKEGNIPLFVGLLPVSFSWTHGQVT